MGRGLTADNADGADRFEVEKSEIKQKAQTGRRQQYAHTQQQNDALIAGALVARLAATVWRHRR
jgi:hypothetical protein